MTSTRGRARPSRVTPVDSPTGRGSAAGTPELPRRATGVVLAVVLLLSLAIRLPYLTTDRLWPDEAFYASQARDFLAEPASLLRVEARTEHLPVVPILLAPGLLLGGLAGLRAITLLLNLVGIFAAYRLGARIGGRFVGLGTALFLAGNSSYLQHSHLVLIDGPFAVAHVGFALALLGVRARTGWDRRDVIAGLAAAGLAVMKWYAFLLVGPILAAYYLVGLRDLAPIQRWRKLLLPAACLGIVAIPYLVWKMGYLGSHGGIVSYFQRPAAHYLLSAPAFAGGPLALGLVLAGGFCLLRQSLPVRVLVISVVVVEVAVMSLAPEKDVRYIVQILPFLGVLYALSFAEVVARVARTATTRMPAHALALVVAALPLVPSVLDRDRTQLQQTYTGLVEAGQVVGRLADPEAVILAGSVRAVRYAAGRRWADRVRPLPATAAELREILERHRGRVIVETDRWEFTQPSWIFPWSDERVAVLEAAGLEQAALVRRPVDGRLQPVALVLVRNGVGTRRRAGPRRRGAPGRARGDRRAEAPFACYTPASCSSASCASSSTFRPRNR